MIDAGERAHQVHRIADSSLAKQERQLPKTSGDKAGGEEVIGIPFGRDGEPYPVAELQMAIAWVAGSALECESPAVTHRLTAALNP